MLAPRAHGSLTRPGDSVGPEGELGAVLLVDAANVIGSRPTGWWRDRPGTARDFVGRVRAAVRDGRVVGPVVVVLEGAGRQGMATGTTDGVTVVHAAGSGDDALVRVVADAAARVTLVSADRALCRRAEALGASVRRPGWLLGLLDR